MIDLCGRTQSIVGVDATTPGQVVLGACYKKAAQQAMREEQASMQPLSMASASLLR